MRIVLDTSQLFTALLGTACVYQLIQALRCVVAILIDRVPTDDDDD